MKILMIGAHQDDMEFQGSGTAMHFCRLGHEVRVLSMANGCGGHHILSPEETSRVRREESRRVGEILGIRYDVCDDVDDCTIVADIPSRRRLTRYIREYSPDLIITHRPNDYHTDHRNTGLLVQDVAYLLTVPHECPDVPAMRFMPVIMYFEDTFRYPPFEADVVVDTDEFLEKKLEVADANASQVYEWLPYTYGQEVPPESDREGRLAFLRGPSVDGMTDGEILAADENSGYVLLYAKTASRHRQKLIERYGEERGRRVRTAEAFMVCEYGAPLTEEKRHLFFPF
ncbi:MAG: PIG-L family deacetylase [Clostridia bacterium]|nr:PIG-L family deacetylase [Clostridia bacterium]